MLAGLAIKQHGTVEEKLLLALREHSARHITVRQLAERFGMEKRAAVEALRAADAACAVTEDLFVHQDYLAQLSQAAHATLAAYHGENPLLPGLRRDELRNRILPGMETTAADRLIDILADRGDLRIENGTASLPTFAVTYTPTQRRMADELIALYREGMYATPELDEVAKRYPKAGETLTQVLSALQGDGTIVQLLPGMYLHRDHYEAAIPMLKEIEAANGEISLGAFRDACNTSRKYALALLETFDKRGITKKTGDMRHVVSH